MMVSGVGLSRVEFDRYCRWLDIRLARMNAVIFTCGLFIKNVN